ncbi:ABC transporter ATP-binding protein [Jiangella alba]|uniref:Peptide/nickel transport system ATP-binding protein n=1 Tax=Jiangella alba TaxID=561176 RepID=A0A1H5KUX3_9ACTN|nr:ABC transporter ATP-binding protein [Jiangella alba]SEE68659.1 peptide/nickel transport system ATP-binding protein [Jiangella alba]
MSLLSVRGLGIRTRTGTSLVRDLSLDVGEGEVVGIVGESGSGKTMTALSLLGLLPEGVQVCAGEAELAGRRFLDGPRLLARPNATMIFQNPTAALNPTMRIGAQLVRLLRFLDRQDGVRRGGDVRERAAALLSSVGIDDPAAVLGRYPHQLSGGMNQRVMIAMAIAARPALLVADEPTTGLDVTVQAQILGLIRATVAEHGVGVLFVSHDMGVIAQLCQRVAVMYDGEVREFAPVDDIFHRPGDAYTRELLASAHDEPLAEEVADGTRAR